jgi:hypothetical protein
MEADMQNSVHKNLLSEVEFARLGAGQVAYMRKVKSDERDNVLVGAQEHELRTVMLQ